MVEGVRKASHRLGDIVDTMFDVSQLDTRTMDLQFTQVRMEDIIAQCADRWMPAVESRKQLFSTTGLSNLPAVRGDAKRLKQVFSNLIQNAIKYTPDGGAITVSGEIAEAIAPDDPVYIEIKVCDTGIGIDAENAERIFEKFFRVGNVMLHSSGETKYKGAGPGLGLTIARGIIEAHGGRIWVESGGSDETNFPGSTFLVLLPVAPPQ
jgi:signal transduction histidine kinase